MRHVPIGNGSLEISVIGLGCMTMAGDYGASEEREAIATIHRAIDLGVNFFDTADVYGRGQNEELLGRALTGRRDSIILGTKFGAFLDADGVPGINGRPEYVAQACDASLARLGVEVIDVYYLHRVDANTPIEDTVGAMSRLIEQGKVRCLGLSEAGAATLQRAHGVHPISALQTEYSLWTRDAEVDVLPLCGELGIAFVAYSPLGRGFLTATVKDPMQLSENDRRTNFPRFQDENLRDNLQLLGAVEDVAKAKGCSPAQVALAWLMSRDVVVIPGAKRRPHLEENVAASGIALLPAEVGALERAFPRGAARGDRYGPHQMGQLNL